MQYIKTPVRVDCWGDLAEADHELLFVGRGPQRVEKIQEAALAINAYDDLIAQRNDLAEAHLVMIRWEDHRCTCTICLSRQGPCRTGARMMEEAVEMREEAFTAVLALVRKSSDAP